MGDVDAFTSMGLNIMQTYFHYLPLLDLKLMIGL